MALSESLFHSKITQSDLYRLTATPENSDSPKKGIVLAVHGLGDHINCHVKAFERLSAMGYQVEGFDWPGNGRSAGRRGDIPGVKPAIKVMWELIEELPEKPVAIYAHSTGGFISLPFLERYSDELDLDWLWLSSPLLRPSHGQGRLKVLAAEFLGDWFPEMTIGTGVRPSRCCKVNDLDPKIIAKEFKECHSRISFRFGRDLILWEDEVMDAARHLRDPLRVLLTQGTDDRVCPAKYAKEFFPTIPVSQKTFLLMEGVRHEPLRDPECDDFLDKVQNWITQETSSPPLSSRKDSGSKLTSSSKID